MKVFRFALAVAIALIGQSASAQAQTRQETREERLQRILAIGADADRQLAPMSAVLKTAGFTGVVGISDGKSFDSWVYDRNKDSVPDKAPYANLWRWASVTKQVVAVLIMQEVASGRIDLDKSVATYLPKFKGPNASRITVRQLLQHQSGLPNPEDVAASSVDASAYYMASYRGSRDPLSGYCSGKPKGEPGGNWAYNNCDYIVAGALLEAVTGKPWQQLVDERIAQRFGLKTLRAFPADVDTRTGIVGNTPEPQLDLASFGASAGLFGSVEDLLKFDHALMSGRLLGKEQLDVLWAGDPKLGYMALGQWVFDASLRGCEGPTRLVERRGGIGGVQLRNFIVPGRNIAVAIFTDKGEGDFEFGEVWQKSGFSYDVLSVALCGTAGVKP